MQTSVNNLKVSSSNSDKQSAPSVPTQRRAAVNPYLQLAAHARLKPLIGQVVSRLITSGHNLYPSDEGSKELVASDDKVLAFMAEVGDKHPPGGFSQDFVAFWLYAGKDFASGAAMFNSALRNQLDQKATAAVSTCRRNHLYSCTRTAF